MSKKNKANLLSIVDSVERILEYIQRIDSSREYYRNQVIFDATLMNFIVIGEMVDRLSAELKEKHPEVDWQKIKAFRNLVAHDYLGIDAEEVWQIIHNHLPKLHKGLQRILDKLPDNE
jgi:uncharacterized protein with HEPN domain